MTDKQNANPTTENESSAPNDNAAVRVTDQEAVRKIIEQYIDNFYLDFDDIGMVYYPIMQYSDWRSGVKLPKGTDEMLEIRNNPAELQKLIDAAKDAIKRRVRKWSLADIFCHLEMPYAFKILKDAKAYISTDEFSQLLRTAWESDDFEYSGSEDFTCDEILELLESCNMQEFMTTDERREFKDFKERYDLTIVYRGFSTNAFLWAPDQTDTLSVVGQYGHADSIIRYQACVKSEDVFALVRIMRYYTGYIVNPQKLFYVELTHDARDEILRREKTLKEKEKFNRMADEDLLPFDDLDLGDKIDRDEDDEASLFGGKVEDGEFPF